MAAPLKLIRINTDFLNGMYQVCLFNSSSRNVCFIIHLAVFAYKL